MSLEHHDIDPLVKNYRGDFTPDVERGLRSLHGRLAPLPVVPATRVRRLRPVWMAAAAVALLLIAAFFLLFNPESDTQLANQSGHPEVYSLPDGSTATLQSGSVLTYNASQFNRTDRQLSLSGQGFFEVAHDATRPFIVTGEEAAVRVTGTSFNLRAEGEVLEVDVSEGTVIFEHAGSELPVKANETAIWEPGRPVVRKEAPTLNHHAWRTGELKFDHTPIGEVLTYFQDNWGVECTWVYGKVCDYQVSANYHSTDVASILRDVAKLGGVELRSTGDDGKHFQLRGSCSK